MDKLQQEIDDLLHGVPEHVGALAWTQDVIAVLKQAATATCNPRAGRFDCE